MPLHNAQESSDRTALPSPPDLAPTSADGVFVPSNGIITLNINRPPTEKKTEGLQYQQVPSEPRKSRVSGRGKAVIRVSGLVFREKHKGRDSCLVIRKGLEISGLWLVNAWEALIRDSHGLRFAASLSCCLAGRGRKNKTEGLQYQPVPNEPRERPFFVSEKSRVS